MPSPQAPILEDTQRNALALVFRTSQPRTSLRRAVHAPSLARTLGFFDESAGLSCMVAFGAHVFQSLTGDWVPSELRELEPIQGARSSAPATGGDLFFLIDSERVDLNFRMAMELRRSLGPEVELIEEVSGFRYLDSRDLTGFVDGTENPGPEERAEVALVGSEDARFEGGSYVLAQRYVHDLAAWEKLAEPEQERVIGRTKSASEELPDDLRPESAHISRVVIERDGRELEIFRKSFPYGNTFEHGLYFVAACRTPETFDLMLKRMFAAEDGVGDRLMEFSSPRSGALFFAPSIEGLAKMAAR